MNWKIALILQKQIPITPIIPIDDAFIGIALSLACLTNNIERNNNFHSWGFVSHIRDKFDICEIDKIVYFHKYTASDLNCFWKEFISHRHICSNGTISAKNNDIKKKALLCKQ